MPSKNKRERFGSKTLVKYAPEQALKVCEAVANGKTLYSVCRGEGMPSRTTFYRWIMLYKDVSTAYQAARELSATSLEEEALEIARALKNENSFTSVKVRALDVALQQLRWSAARRDPAKYGQRAKETIVVPIQINTTLDLGDQHEGGQGVYTIKAEILAPTGVDSLSVPVDPPRSMIPKKEKK